MNKWLKRLAQFSGLLSAIIFVIPVMWVILSSFKSGYELFAWPPTFFPKNPSLQNYIYALNKSNFARYFANSIYVSSVSTMLTLVINAMAGYALAKFSFKGDQLIFYSFIATLMIPLQVILVPIFLVVKSLGLYNSLWGIIIPPAATPTGVFLVRQYMVTIPDEIMESARIDGASEWRIFWIVMMPLAKPVLTALTIFSFMWRWNDFLWPFIVIGTERKYTIQVAIANFVGQFSVDWGSLLAVSVIAMIPVLIVFFIFQRHFMKGIALSGMKM